MMDIISAIFSGIWQVIVQNIGSIMAWIIMCLLAIVSAFFGFKGYQFVTSQAKKKPSLRVYLYDRAISNNIYILLPFRKNTIYQIPLVVIIENKGTKTAKNVKVTVDISDSLYQRDMTRIPSELSRAMGVTHATDHVNNEMDTRVYTKIPDIDPGIIYSVEDSIGLSQPSVVEHTFNATSQDGVPVSVDTLCIFVHSIKVKLTYEDNSPIIRNYQMHIRRECKHDIKSLLAVERKLINDSTWPDGVAPVSMVYFTKFGEPIKPAHGSSETPKKVVIAKRNSYRIITLLEQNA